MVECKQSLTDHPGGILEDSGAIICVGCGGSAYEVSEESKDVNSGWAHGHSCDTLAESLAVISMDSHSSVTISPNKSFFL